MPDQADALDAIPEDRQSIASQDQIAFGQSSYRNGEGFREMSTPLSEDAARWQSPEEK